MNCLSCGDPIANPTWFLCPACREAGEDPPADDNAAGSPPPWDDDPLGRVCYVLWRDTPTLFLRWFGRASAREHLDMACTYARARNQIEQPITPFDAAAALDMWYAALDAAGE